MNPTVERFYQKYSHPDITKVDLTEDQILVFTPNAKVWVDIPSTFEGFYVKMIYHRKN